MIFATFSKPLLGFWREPVLRHPVIIFESDDWGPGPLEQAAVLNRLRLLLCRYSDAVGRHPVMTLGLTLAAPRVELHEDGTIDYARCVLSDPQYAEILDAVHQGLEAGVFAPQLHGMEHYLPEVVVAAAATDPQVKDWLAAGDRYTELLPDHLQSRWLDTSVLPSTEHPGALIDSAVQEEVSAFESIFGYQPRVAVPNTFAWTGSVERAWAGAGIKYLVTCGKRFVSRDTAGSLVDDGAVLVNGAEGNELTYLVRDAYFEPAKGHRAEQALAAVRRYADCARPVLLETHRYNFTSLNTAAEQAFTELEALIAGLLRDVPQIRFLATEELGDAFANQSTDILDISTASRLRAWLHRVTQYWPIRKYTRLSGGQLLISLLLFLLPSRSVE